MHGKRELLGAGLEALADGDPAPIDELVDVEPGWRLPALAAATPYLRRVAAVHEAAAAGGAGVDMALRAAARAASMHGHRVGALSDTEVLTNLLGAAVDARLLRLSTSVVRPGDEAALISDHPLAAWGESLFVVYSDPLERWQAGSGALLPLLYQYIVRRPESDLEPCVEATRRELVEAAGRRGAQPPSRRGVRRLVTALAALLEELGVVTWRRGGNGLGTARPTFLGVFGWSLLMTEMHGPTPATDRLLRDHGYLPAAAGYVHRNHVPVDFCDN